VFVRREDFRRWSSSFSLPTHPLTRRNKLKLELQRHLERVKLLHEQDVAEGFGRVYLPHALARKYPNADREWGWQWAFPSARRSIDPRSQAVRRHHAHELSVQRAMKEAVLLAKLPKPAT